MPHNSLNEASAPHLRIYTSRRYTPTTQPGGQKPYLLTGHGRSPIPVAGACGNVHTADGVSGRVKLRSLELTICAHASRDACSSPGHPFAQCIAFTSASYRHAIVPVAEAGAAAGVQDAASVCVGVGAARADSLHRKQ